MIESKALLTDLYELTMAYGFWKKGLQDREAAFHLFFRRRPFGGSFAIAAGLQPVCDFIQNFQFTEDDLSYLRELNLFDEGFLEYLRTLVFRCDIDAVEEGTPVFPYEPLLRIKGPILQAQLLESALLNIINFQTLIATKAARICFAAGEDEVVEFGLRRAQGVDGAISAARAAFIGGCRSTSNVLAGKLFDIPVKGTMAHSWVMAFPSEKEAFEAYAEASPEACVFLVDTYDSIEGTKKAIAVARRHSEKEFRFLGVRLDSGDLAHLSIAIRKLLDEAGFKETKIMASNELDESIIRDLKQQGARIDIWGVGTNLVTGKEQPALDGVYKLSAIKNEKDKWQYKVKISEQLVKVTDPGLLEVKRFEKDGMYIADMIYDKSLQEGRSLISPLDPTEQKIVGDDLMGRDLLKPIFRKGRLVLAHPHLKEMQARARSELGKFHPSVRRFLHPHPYFVGLEKGLYDKKMALIKGLK